MDKDYNHNVMFKGDRDSHVHASRETAIDYARGAGFHISINAGGTTASRGDMDTHFTLKPLRNKWIWDRPSYKSAGS